MLPWAGGRTRNKGAPSHGGGGGEAKGEGGEGGEGRVPLSAACAQIGRAIRTLVTGEQNTRGGRRGRPRRARTRQGVSKETEERVSRTVEGIKKKTVLPWEYKVLWDKDN